jgi:hypothetical protein
VFSIDADPDERIRVRASPAAVEEEAFLRACLSSKDSIVSDEGAVADARTVGAVEFSLDVGDSGEDVLAVLPGCERYVVLVGRPRATLAAATRVFAGSPAEARVARRLLDAVGARARVTAARGSAEAVQEALASPDPSACCCSMGTASELAAALANAGQPVALVAYDDALSGSARRHVVKMSMPFLQQRNVDLKLTVLPQMAENDPARLQALLATDTLVVAGPMSASVERAADAFVGRVLARGADAQLAQVCNFYAQYFRFKNVTLARLRRADRDLDARVPPTGSKGGNEALNSIGYPYRAVLRERFGDEQKDGEGAIELRPAGNVRVFLTHGFDGRQRRLELLDGPEIDGVPLRPGDRVALRGQANADENGAYVYVRDGPGELVDVRPLAIPMEDMDSVAVSVRGGRVAVAGLHTKQGSWRSGDRALLQNYGNASFVVERAHGDRIDLVEDRPDGPGDPDDADDPEDPEGERARQVVAGAAGDGAHVGSCFGDNAGDALIRNKQQCESRYDPSGVPKPGGPGVWDRPCTRDVECPYFQANKTYKNYRGACLDGHCELPLGVSRVSFRVGRGQPLCHPDGPCSAERPDVAFERDEHERTSSVVVV